MSNQIDPNVDPYGYMGMALNLNGSITRVAEISTTTPACSNRDSNPDYPVLSKDIPINESNKTWVRVFLPHKVFDSDKAEKLQVIVYYHGGGLVQLSPATTTFHEFCTKAAIQIPAVIVSQEYRLAPEHRLPAAYDDCVEALQWLKTTSDEWLTKYADFSKCYLMGSSAGGNVAYHTGLRAVGCVDDLNPVKIRGLIMHEPFFGGTERTLSELRLIKDKVIPPGATDLMWELALPKGFDRDHEYCNPTVVIKSEALEQIKEHCRDGRSSSQDEGDPLIDRQIELAKVLKEKGLRVVDEFHEGRCHGYVMNDNYEINKLFCVLKNFVKSL